MQFAVIVCHVEGYRNILKLRSRPLSSTYLRNRKKSGTSVSVQFFVWFLKKNISLVIFVNWKRSFSGCLYLMRYWTICVL